MYVCMSVTLRNDNFMHTNITSILSSLHGGFGEGQQSQKVNRNCTVLTFNVFYPNDSETITLFADGSASSSTKHVNICIQLSNCTYPVGFESFSCNSRSTRCECICDSALSPYITNCNSTTNSLLRVNLNLT